MQTERQTVSTRFQATLPVGCVPAVALVLLLTPSVPAQSPSSPPVHLGSVSVTGVKRFSAEKVVAASGLRIGQAINPQDLTVAADLLAKSGAFADIRYGYRIDQGEMRVEFELREARRFLPCIFDNFVGFSDEELRREVHSRVPLFDGYIPEGGWMAEQVAATLEGLVRAAGFNARVEHVPEGRPGQPVEAFLFRIAGIPMLVRRVRFSGDVAISESTLAKHAAGLLGQDFSIFFLREFISADLLPFYHERGYLHAQFAEPRAHFLSEPGAGATKGVEITLLVNEGHEYHWLGADWEGEQSLSAPELDRLLGMKAGQVANTWKIEAGLNAVRQAYESRGYLEAIVRAQSSLDDATLSARSHVSIREGPQYRMGSLLFAGVPPDLEKAMRKNWHLKPGAILDGSYPAEFNRKMFLWLAKREAHPAPFVITFALHRDSRIADVRISIH